MNKPSLKLPGRGRRPNEWRQEILIARTGLIVTIQRTVSLKNPGFETKQTDRQMTDGGLDGKTEKWSGMLLNRGQRPLEAP